MQVDSQNQNIDKNDKDSTYQTYLDYRNSLHELSVNQSNLFDTQLLAISAATLGFSIAFIEKIVPKQEAIWNATLYTAWAFLLISTIAILISFQSAKNAALDYRKQVDDFYNETRAIKQNISSKFEKYTHFLNKAAILFFYAGILFLVIFITANLIVPQNNQKGNHVEQKQNMILGGANPNKPLVQQKKPKKQDAQKNDANSYQNPKGELNAPKG